MESTGRDDAQIVRSRVRFPGISSRAYEHPADRGALTTLRSVPGFPAVLKAVSGAFTERGERLYLLGSAVRVGPKQYRELHELRADCCAVLDIDPVPDMFVMRHPVANGMALGLDQPFVVLTTGLIELLDTESLRVAIGHELGHVLSGHALYRTLLFRMINLMQGMQWLPVGYWGLRVIVAALKEWYRKAELSADRAGLLCSQDPAAALRGHVLMAGAVSLADVDTAEFLRQASDYESGGDVRDSVLKLINIIDDTHPLEVVRAAELQRWAASEEYRAILSGEYPRRDTEEQPHSTWTEDMKDAARSYRDSFVQSTDPLAKVLNEVGGVISDTASKVFQRFGNRQDTERQDTERQDAEPATEE